MNLGVVIPCRASLDVQKGQRINVTDLVVHADPPRPLLFMYDPGRALMVHWFLACCSRSSSSLFAMQTLTSQWCPNSRTASMTRTRPLSGLRPPSSGKVPGSKKVQGRSSSSKRFCVKRLVIASTRSGFAYSTCNSCFLDHHASFQIPLAR